MKGTIE
jgi:hypothetical protein